MQHAIKENLTSKENIVFESENVTSSHCNNFSLRERKQLSRSWYFGAPKMKNNHVSLSVVMKKKLPSIPISLFLHFLVWYHGNKLSPILFLISHIVLSYMTEYNNWPCRQTWEMHLGRKKLLLNDSYPRNYSYGEDGSMGISLGIGVSEFLWQVALCSGISIMPTFAMHFRNGKMNPKL